MTLTSIESPTPLCPELQQLVGVGETASADLIISRSQDVTLELTEPDDEGGFSTIIYQGSQTGNSIVAEAMQGTFGGIACPGAAVETP